MVSLLSNLHISASETMEEIDKIKQVHRKKFQGFFKITTTVYLRSNNIIQARHYSL